jgi:hypothetical protein
MRAPAFFAALSLPLMAFAQPAFGQIAPPVIPPAGYTPITPLDAGLLVQQEAMRQQLVQQQNQLQALDAQLRLQQSQLEIERLKVSPRLPPPDTSSGKALPQIDVSQLASIPDAALADSNKRVLDAANNHR